MGLLKLDEKKLGPGGGKSATYNSSVYLHEDVDKSFSRFPKD